MCHLGRQGARPARRKEHACQEHASDEQRGPAGCIGVQCGEVIPVRALKVGTKNIWRVIQPTAEWRALAAPPKRDEFEVSTDLYFIDVVRKQ